MSHINTDASADREKGTEFLRRFYESETVECDNLGKKLASAVLPESIVDQKRRTGRLAWMKGMASELKEEGGAGDQVLYDDIFEVDSEGFITTENRKLSRRTKVSLFLLLVLIPLTIALGV